LLPANKSNQDEVIAMLEAQNAKKDIRIAKLERDMSNALAIAEKGGATVTFKGGYCSP